MCRVPFGHCERCTDVSLPSGNSYPAKDVGEECFEIELFDGLDKMSLLSNHPVFWGYLPSGKLTWHWKIPISRRKYIFQWSIFHCYVSFQGFMLNFR